VNVPYNGVWHHGLTIAQSKTGVFAEEGPENHPPNFDMPYDSECAFAGVHCTGLFLGDEVLLLGHTTDSCLHDLLPER